MYGLLLIVDPEHPDPEIPATGNECSSTKSCVAVPVRPYVDGPVTVWLGPATALPEGIEIFSGVLDTPSGKLAVTAPEDSDSVTIDVAESNAEITISVDDPANASRVSVGVAD